MNGIHDMGGMHGFGAIPDIDGPEPFHHDWERHVFAMNVALGGLGLWNIDMTRAEMEATAPEDYLAPGGYFYRFLLRMERQALKYDLASPEEISSGVVSQPPRSGLSAMKPEQIAVMAAKGSSSMRPTESDPRFKVGDRVRARRINPETHTRLPRYVRGCEGVITRVQGSHVYPDDSCHGDENPQWLYAVRFAGTEIWGKNAEAGLEVVIDAFEPYLEPA